MGARLCTEEGRLLARAVPLRNTRRDYRQRGAPRVRNKRACCASSPERASAVAHKRGTRANTTKYGQGWHVGALPCTEEGRLLAIALRFYNASSGFRQRGAVRARNKHACLASSPERANAVARKRATRVSHPTKCGPELARASTALHRRKVASRSCGVLPWCMKRLSPARRGASARNKRACCASSPERASAVAHKRATRASHPTK